MKFLLQVVATVIILRCKVQGDPCIRATCKFEGAGTGSVSGELTLNFIKGKVGIRGFLNNLPRGKLGFHVHESGDLGNDCKNAGSHFNPQNVNHGGPDDLVRHAGDLGNIQSAGGTVRVAKLDTHISLGNDTTSIINRAIVVHERADDLGKGGLPESKTTGNAGGRIGCCRIVLSKPPPPQG